MFVPHREQFSVLGNSLRVSLWGRDSLLEGQSVQILTNVHLELIHVFEIVCYRKLAPLVTDCMQAWPIAPGTLHWKLPP